MYKNKKFLAIIPARGGSKRLPKKNILDLCGKPLISWSIEAGLKSKYIDQIVVSSDDDAVLCISKQYDITTIKRPENLSKDTSSTFQTIEHTIDFFKNNLGQEFDYIILLQPTSPLRTPEHIDEAIELLYEKKATCIMSVTIMEHSPLWSNTLDDTLSMEDFLSKDVINVNSQDLQKYYRLNGAIALCQKDRLLEEKSFFIKKNIFAYVMPQKYSIDIDTLFDLNFASFLLKSSRKNN